MINYTLSYLPAQAMAWAAIYQCFAQSWAWAASPPARLSLAPVRVMPPAPVAVAEPVNVVRFPGRATASPAFGARRASVPATGTVIQFADASGRREAGHL